MLKRIKDRFRRINAVIEKENLSKRLGCFGVMIDTIFYLIMTAASFVLLIGWLGNIEFCEGAQATISERGLEFIFNKWFWGTVFFGSMIMSWLGHRFQLASQLERKIGNKAMRDWRRKNDFPLG